MRKILINIVLIVVVIVNISSCVSTYNRLLKNPNFKFQKSDKNGLAALSVQCYGLNNYTPYNFPIVLSYFGKPIKQDTAFSWTLTSYDDTISFTCLDDYPHYFVIQLPAGQYYFGDLSFSDLREGYFAKHFEPIYFNVYSRKINYIGNFSINLNRDTGLGRVQIIVRNNAISDVPMFRMQYRNIPKSQYVIDIARLGKKRS